MTDIITNTLGAALGALLVRSKVVQNMLKENGWLSRWAVRAYSAVSPTLK